MIELLPHIQKYAVLVFLVSSMLAMGLAMPVRAVASALRNGPLVVSTLILNFLLAPGLSWLLAYCLRLSPGHTAGLILLGCAAGAPFLPKVVEVARGDLTLAAALVILLTAGTILFMPFALPLLTPELATKPSAIAMPLLQLIVAPMIAGMVARPLFPQFSAKAAPVLAKIGTLALLITFLALVGANARALVSVVGSGAILAALLHFLLLFGIGWRFGNQHTRSVLALGTAARNFGAALVPIAGAGNVDATMMLIVSAVVGLILAFCSAAWAKNRPAALPPAS